MILAERLQQTLEAFGARKDGITGIEISAPDSWSVEAAFTLPAWGTFRIRSMREDDVATLDEFGRRLSPTSRHFFCPYPWDDAEKLPEALRIAVDQAVKKIDIAYFLEHDGGPIGFFFLWKGGGNPHSQAHGIEVPELGVAVTDAWQGRGFGALAVLLLEDVAAVVGADAIELTTALDNNAGWQAYLRAGFDYIGIISNPLDVDVTAVTAGEATACRYRDERQMVYHLNPATREAVLRYLQFKRETAAHP
ncbi:MAG TPA: GNAT family N-acetyltransferase [Armatimonadota bacterium]|jgi:GNAT superfamily N-acetyltransferase